VTGLWTIRFTLIALVISPLCRLAGQPKIALTRRILGVSAMAYGLAHLLLYALDQKFRWWTVAHEIALRIYLTIGFITLVAVCTLGATSTDGWIRRLGRNWKRLHQAIFAVGALGLLHFFMQSKANVSEPVLMAGLFLWLVIWRALPTRWRDRFLPLLVLAVICGIGAALIEFAWYGLATGVPAIRVLKANLSSSFGIRPAIWVAVTAGVVACLAAIRSLGLSAIIVIGRR
jgi:methionine sulfoxide reductase heme-binding subunit